jgi:hypothetical protein
MRRPAGLAALVLLAATTAACGGGSDRADSDYCSTLKTEKAELTKLAEQAGEPGKDVLTPTLDAFGKLREASPQALRDEWDTVYYAWQGLVDAVREAGVDPSDYRPGTTPDGVSSDDARRLAEVAAELASARVVDATSGLEDHARQVCDVELRV